MPLNLRNSLIFVITLLATHTIYSQTRSAETYTGILSDSYLFYGGYNSIYGFNAGRTIRTNNGSSLWYEPVHNAFNNSILGASAGYSLFNGDRNILFGVAAGYYNDGSNNVFIGYRSGYNTTGSNNVFLGYQAGYNETGSNKLYIDNSSTASPLIWGDFANNILSVNGNLGVGTTSPVAKLDIRSSGTLAGKFDATKAYFRIGDGTYDMLMDGNEIIANGSIFIASGASPGQDIYFRNVDTNGAENLMIIKSEGNVGIGTTSPAAKLDVDGKILSKGLRIPGRYDLGVSEGALELEVPTNSYNAIRAVNGTQGAGTIHFFDDTWGSGEASNSAGSINIHGQTAVTIGSWDNPGTYFRRSDGYVGIGVTDPSEKLEVNGNIRTQGLTGENYNITGVNELTINDEGEGINFHDKGEIKIIDDDTDDKFYIGPGKVGIGTTDIKAKLDIRSSGTLAGKYDESKAYFRIGDGTYDMLMDGNEIIANGSIYIASGASPGQDIHFRNVDTNGAENLMIIKSEGQVGIGTETPSEQLHVVGNIKASGTLSASGYNPDDWDDAHGWGDHGVEGYYKSGSLPDFGDGLNLRGPSPTIHFNNTDNTDEVSLHLEGDWFYILGHENSNGDSHNIGWDQNESHWPFRINLTNDDIELGGKTSIKEGNFVVESGSASINGTLIVEEGLAINTTAVASGYVADIKGSLRVRGKLTTNKLQGTGDGGALKVQTENGYVEIGPQNGSLSHFETDMSAFHFNNEIQLDSAEITSLNELPMKLNVRDGTGLSISPTKEVTVHGNLNLQGGLSFGDIDRITNYNEGDSLLVLRDNSLAYRDLASIESPWLLKEVLNAQDSLVYNMVCKDSLICVGEQDVIIIDVFDLNGNLKIGENAFIDDDSIKGGVNDDWMQFDGAIGFRSDSTGYGIKLYDADNINQFLNLYHNNNVSYFASTNSSDDYFMKAEGKKVSFASEVDIPVLNIDSIQGNHDFIVNFDLLDDANEDRFVIRAGDADYQDLLVVNESGNVDVKNGDLTIATGGSLVLDSTPIRADTLEQVLVRDPNTGATKHRHANSIGPWSVNNPESPEYLSFNGRVGINTSVYPAADLEVNGTALINQQLSVKETAIFQKGIQADSINTHTGVFTDLHGSSEEWNQAANTLANKEVNWDSAYAQRGSQIAGSGLTWDGSQLSVDEINLPWSDDNGTLSYTGNVAVNGTFNANSFSASTLSTSTTTTGTLQVTALSNGDNFTQMLVEDGLGNVGTKSINSLDLSPWTKNGTNLSFNTGTVSTTGLISNVANANDLVFIGQLAGTESFRLFGNGIVEAKEVVVSLDLWPDYVFEEDYELRPLEEVEQYVKDNNHLPDVPSEAEVSEEGVKVGEMEAILLQKVEELTLYLIDQNKELKEQSELIQEQAQLIKELQEKID